MANRSQLSSTSPLPDIFITPELERRPRRPPDYQAENRGLVVLARALTQDPDSILQRVTEMAMELCQAPAAGISLLEQVDGQPVFRWRALAGTYAAHLDGMAQRDFSPCGVVLDRRQAQLVAAPERYYTSHQGLQPPIVECLLLPLFVAGEVKGTLWVVAHDTQRQFDAEDVRILSSLAEFAAAAYRLNEGFTSVVCKQEELERSIQESKRAAAALLQAKEAAEAANRLKSEFVATMSHELRTPLNVILGYTDMLMESAARELLPPQIDILQRIDHNSRVLFELINMVLDLNRLEAGRLPVEVKEVHVPEFLAEIKAEIQGLCDQSGLAFYLAIAPGLPVMHLDPGKLKVVLKNLLSNAVKFTSQGSVTLAATEHRGGIEFCVTDTGIGIPAEAHAYIFEPFRQLHGSDTQRYNGSGLGLHIVQRLVDVLGGTIAVESIVGHGSNFRVWLPVYSASAV